MAGGRNMKELQQMLAEKRAQLDRLTAEINALEELSRRVSGEPLLVTSARQTRRTNLKGIVIDMLREALPKGLNAGRIVEIAASRGMPLERASVSSLLSRLKGEGIATYDGDTYTLTNGKPQKEEGAETSANPFVDQNQGVVLPYPASKGVFG